MTQKDLTYLNLFISNKSNVKKFSRIWTCLVHDQIFCEPKLASQDLITQPTNFISWWTFIHCCLFLKYSIFFETYLYILCLWYQFCNHGYNDICKIQGCWYNNHFHIFLETLGTRLCLKGNTEKSSAFFSWKSKLCWNKTVTIKFI